MEHKTGLTKDAGWQFGIRKTVPLGINEVWECLFSEKGIMFWAKGADKNFSTFKELSHIRTKWKIKDWENQATLQMRVISNKDKTTIAFHIDRLLSENQRAETKKHWTEVLENITKELNSKITNR